MHGQPPSFNQLQLNDKLSSPKTFERIAFIANLIKDSGSSGSIYKAVQDLTRIVRKDYDQLGELTQKYENLLLELRFASFQLLSDDEIREIFNGKLLFAYKQELDLSAKVSLVFAPFFGPEDHGRLSAMIKGLEENRELVGNQNITLKDGKVVGSLISNWLKDYKTQVVEDKGTLNLISYITKNQNAKKLSTEELGFLKYVLNFYDWLRFKASKISYLNEISEFDVPKFSKPTNQEKITNDDKLNIEQGSFPSSKPVTTVVAQATQEPKVEMKKVVEEVRVAAEPEKVGFKTEFEQKLAAAGTVHGGSLSDLKAKIEQTVEKNEGEELRNKNREIRNNEAGVRMTAEEIKREVETPELPAHSQATTKPVPMPARVTFAVPKAPIAPPKAPEVPKQPIIRPNMTLDSIKVVDDLKKLEVANIRDGDLVGRVKEIKSKIVNLTVSNNLLPFYTVAAFEQSPLFKAYMLHGSSKVGGGVDAGGLTQAEFEALADLRKEIERL